MNEEKETSKPSSNTQTINPPVVTQPNDGQELKKVLEVEILDI